MPPCHREQDTTGPTRLRKTRVAPDGRFTKEGVLIDTDETTMTCPAHLMVPSRPR